MQRTALEPSKPREMMQVKAAIPLIKEAALPVVASLDNVKGHIRKDNPSTARHGPTTPNYAEALTENVVCPCF